MAEPGAGPCDAARGFPEGRTVLPYNITTVAGAAERDVGVRRIRRASPILAMFYSTLAQSDAVQRLMYRDSGVHGTMERVAGNDRVRLQDDASAALLDPGHGRRPPLRRRRRARGRHGGRSPSFLANEQSAGGRACQGPRPHPGYEQRRNAAALVTARKKTIPIVVLFTVLIATLGLAFILENLRPLVRPVENPVADRASEHGASIRSA